MIFKRTLSRSLSRFWLKARKEGKKSFSLTAWARGLLALKKEKRQISSPKESKDVDWKRIRTHYAKCPACKYISKYKHSWGTVLWRQLVLSRWNFWPGDKSLSNGYSQIWMDFILVSAKLVGSMEHNGNIWEKVDKIVGRKASMYWSRVML